MIPSSQWTNFQLIRRAGSDQHLLKLHCLLLFSNNRIKYLMFFERTIENGVNWSIAWQGLQRDCCQTLAYFIGAEKKTLVFGTIETRQEGMNKLQLLSSSASRIKITPFYHSSSLQVSSSHKIFTIPHLLMGYKINSTLNLMFFFITTKICLFLAVNVPS